MVNILISNSKDEKWVEREIDEFNDDGIMTMRGMLEYWANHFYEAKYPPKKFKIFMNNFVETAKRVSTYK